MVIPTMNTTDCLLSSTDDKLKELVELGFTYELKSCDNLSKSGKYYVRRRREALVKSILNAAKRTTSNSYLRLKLRRYKYIAKYAKISIKL